MRSLTLCVRRYDGGLGRARVFCTYGEACRRVAELRRHPQCALAWIHDPTPAYRPRTYPRGGQAFCPAPPATRPMEVMK